MSCEGNRKKIAQFHQTPYHSPLHPPYLCTVHDLEPHFAWINLYSAAQDPRSPFFEREYNEFYFDKAVYNYYIHPQWDQFGSNTLYIKILFADYQEGFAIIEMIGEWNDALYNDVMHLKREVLEILMQDGIRKFVMIGENVMNFHASDDAYYEEWFQDVEAGLRWSTLENTWCRNSAGNASTSTSILGVSWTISLGARWVHDSYLLWLMEFLDGG